jgi:peptidoglycan/LPS O-acetylase OafA/YrhL
LCGIHSWAFANNPSLKIAGVDLYRSVAIVGNGVDFFFVISGFFMFMVFSGNYSVGIITVHLLSGDGSG